MRPGVQSCATIAIQSSEVVVQGLDHPKKGNRMNRNRPVSRWLLLAAVILSLTAASFAQIAVGISVRVGPPALPVYAQPICPGPGYMWTPGYWAWNDDAGYYWVPGTWVVAPVGLLWTPGYWGWGGGLYLWHAGYWGPHIGFYGGINYGFGYGGVGFAGGEWRGGAFYYNRSVTNVSVTNVTNVYNRTVIVNENHVAFNGGEGGVRAEPNAEERMAEHEQHRAALSTQTEHEHMASQNRQNFASENHGRPAIAATARPGDFSSRSAISARAAGGEYHAPAMSPREARGPSNAGNRPFTPAHSNNANRSMGNSKPTPQDRSNNGFRPFTPPNRNAGGNNTAMSQNRPNQTHPDQNRPNQYRPSESRPQNQQHSQNAPRPESHKSSPPPKSPKEDHHKGK
jgi:WXXGXW repeat (2 copies)